MTDARSPMRRLLEATLAQGAATPDFDRQHVVIRDAHELGYLTLGIGYGVQGQITDLGRAWLADPANL